MGALTASIIAIAGIALGWITIEIACKPCLEQGRRAIDRSLNADYDPDDDDRNIRAPLNPNPPPPPPPPPPPHSPSTIRADDSASTVVKIV